MDQKQFLQYVKECFEELEGNIAELKEEGVSVPVLELPLTGFADAEDPIFESYKDPVIIGPEARTPREIMPEAGTVAAFFFPFTEDIRTRHAAAVTLTDEAWGTGYPLGMGLSNAFLDALQAKLEQAGVKVCQPQKDPDNAMNRVNLNEDGIEDIHFSVGWSTRHALYAAGLGTFGIHRHIITEKGVCGTLATLLIDAKIEPTERTYTDPYEYCTRCGECTKRCPAGAITVEHLRNLKLCSGQSAAIREAGLQGPCGKCLVGTPCEFKRPEK